MPVDQTGENILFVLEQDSVEAHIQIQVAADAVAEQFAWVIPMMEIPAFSLGSQEVFDRMLSATVPRYGFRQTFENCSEPGVASGSDNAEDASSETGSDSDDGTKVVLQRVVGAYEIAVLSGGTAESVFAWLAENGFAQDENARPILQEYLNEGYLFVALKLRKDAGISEIQPIVLRYGGNMPCVPIRLTRIAAQENMDLRTFFLSRNRVVPANYRHVEINEAKLDWLNFAANYREVIQAAVDVPDALGNAFVTEFAGDSAVADMSTIQRFLSWDTTLLSLSDTPLAAMNHMKSQRMLDCDPFLFADDADVDSCYFDHPLLEPLLARYLPVPSDLSPRDFYQNLELYQDRVDAEAWNPTELASAMQERIVAPAIHALEIFGKFNYLSRLYTTISPGEMTSDPMFHEDSTLPPVTNVHMAQLVTLCDDRQWMELPDGTKIAIEDQVWPAFDETMPWELEVRSLEIAGQGVVLHTRDVDIKKSLATWNAGKLPDGRFDNDMRWISSGCACDVSASRPGTTGLGAFALFGLLAWHRRRTNRREPVQIRD